MICLVACDRKINTESYTKTEVEWQGATAESIAESVRTIIPAPDLAVIYDGKATLYYRKSVTETHLHLDASVDRLPKAFVLSSPIAREGNFPEAPKPEEQVMISFVVDRARAASHGIPVTDISSYLNGLDLKQDEDTVTQALRGKTLTTSSGDAVALDSVVATKATTVNRPIILSK